MRVLNVLIACEESQAICKEFRNLGHIAWSCDLQECSGGHPEWHINGDCTKVIDGDCDFITQDRTLHHQDGKWDLIMSHPPCTHLAVSGAQHFPLKREDGRQREAIELFCKFFYAKCDHIAIENPVNIISGNYITKYFPDLCEKYGLPRNATQTIQPYEHGDPYKKTTNLWLKGLPEIVPTKIVKPNLISYRCKNGKIATFSKDYGGGDGKRRSKTYMGIARAIAKQWSDYLVDGVYPKGDCEPLF